MSGFEATIAESGAKQVLDLLNHPSPSTADKAHGLWLSGSEMDMDLNRGCGQFLNITASERIYTKVSERSACGTTASSLPFFSAASERVSPDVIPAMNCISYLPIFCVTTNRFFSDNNTNRED